MKMLFMVLTTLFAVCVAQAANISGYEGNASFGQQVTIANTAQSSSLIKLNGFVLVGIQTPAALTGTALTFEVCDSTGVTCVPLKTTTSGTALSYTVTTSSFYAIDPTPFHGVQYLKIKSGTAEGGARVLVVSLKGL
jgi:hypothetical protein